MNYYPVTVGQTDGQKAMHMNPLCNMHRWAQKLSKSAPNRTKLDQIDPNLLKIRPKGPQNGTKSRFRPQK